MAKVKTKAPSKADLKQQIAELQAALKEKATLENAQALSGDLAGPQMVPLKNFSGNYIFYPYQWRGQDRKLELTATGRKQMASVPLEIWYELERDTALVTEGYIARVDRPITNPNIIEDAAAIVENLTETDFADRMTKITNISPLFALVAFLEPLKQKTGKQLSAQTAVRKRVQELSGTTITDDY